MMATDTVSFDASLFQKSSTPMKSCSATHDNCIVIKRILSALSYYSHLDVNNINDRSIFIDFMDTIYKHQVYDDKFHFTKFHQDDIESVAKLAITAYSCRPCDLSICSHSDRHFRVEPLLNNNSTTNSNEDMKHFYVHTEIMDSLHFNVFHLIDGGLRESIKTSESEIHEEKQNMSTCFDGTFLKMRDNIKATRTKTDRFTRLGGNKYNISAVNDAVDSNKDTIEDVSVQEKKR